MAYTEKVSLNGTALSFLLYECTNSANTQEGFLIGDVTSEITNHISDSQSDNARLDTQIFIRTVLPLPSVSLFYLPSGRIKEDVLKNLLSNSANEVVGWYKYRNNSNIKPTFRDKLIAKGLQKYFEKHYGKKNFVTCNLSKRTSQSGSTHTFTYRFGKINCFDMYEYIDDVTGNLGEKHTGYKKAQRVSPHCVFNDIVKEHSVQNTTNPSDAILCIQEAVNTRLLKEAKIAAKNERIVRELEEEIKHMSSILTEKHYADLSTAYNKMIEDKILKQETEMAEACIEAMKTPLKVNILNVNNVINKSNCLSNCENANHVIEHEINNDNASVASTSQSNAVLSYAAALKNHSDIESTSKSNNLNEDLITFDVEDKRVKKTIVINYDDNKFLGDSSPEY